MPKSGSLPVNPGELAIMYMEILEKVSNIIKNKFNSGLVHSKKYVKADKIDK